MAEETPEPATVAFVDDDRELRMTVVRGLEQFSLHCRPFATGDDFLEALKLFEFDCVVLDLRMPGKTGLEVLRQIPEDRNFIPVIILTSHGDVPTAVCAIREGALEFLEKPVSIRHLSESIHSAIDLTKERRQEAIRLASARRTLASLSSREQEIVDLVASGLRNQAIAVQLGLSKRTVEFHRYNAMKKLNARNVADLIKLTALVQDQNAF